MSNLTEPLEKRLERLFLTHITDYDVRYFQMPLGIKEWHELPPIWFANKMVEIVMGMIDDSAK